MYIIGMNMHSVNVTELRQHLPDYLKQVQQGEEIAITLHGKTIARIVPDHQESKRDAAFKRLEALRGSVIVGDILAPIDEEWTGDADNL
jgi:prevent-host-death family protein